MNYLTVLQNGLIRLFNAVRKFNEIVMEVRKMLNGKIAIVTGGGSGIGSSTAIELARNRADVFILGRTEEKLIDTIKLAEQEKLELHYKVCDVSNINEVKIFINELSKNGTVPDIIVNCAGVINVKKDDGGFDNDIVFRVNIMGMMNICDEVIQSMISCGKHGTIISIASIAGHYGSSDFPSYAASKGAVFSYTKSLAMKYGRYGIRANTISPGVIVTPMSYIETPNISRICNMFFIIQHLYDIHRRILKQIYKCFPRYRNIRSIIACSINFFSNYVHSMLKTANIIFQATRN